MSSLLAALAAIFLFPRFERFVERRILGMPLPPTHLLRIYSTRIAASPDLPGLVQLLKDEVFPSLLVRQAVLLRFDDWKRLVPLDAMGMGAADLPTERDVPALLAQAGKFRPALDPGDAPFPCPWARLVLPLNVGDELVGLLLLGRRDPDDFYGQVEIPTLEAIAAQTAVALTHTLHAEQLRALNQANIERHENERTSLARGLHDQVLQEMAAMLLHIDNPPPQFDRDSQNLVNNLRRVISGLRPAMLDHGLHGALRQLAYDLEDRASDGLVVKFDVPESTARFEPQVEQHLFRIIQQAAGNAMKHACARTISIGGRVEPGAVDLTVEDDGVGFVAREKMELDDLLADKHYGLVGLHERAEIIGGRLQIDSAPGKGTRVQVTWTPLV
ncbi:MAG: sensor histidine kinase [Chloroflexi bacterium]|nr:sensor histidine kinase [Chloroflexota bacterium]